METLSSEIIRQLTDEVGPPCVSIMVPMERGVFDQPTARIDLKNLVAKARATIGSRLSKHDTQLLFASADELLQDDAKLADLDCGFALFLSPSTSIHVRLPEATEPLVMVGERFDILPLLSMVTPDYDYFVLTLSRNLAKVCKGTRHTFTALDIPDMPENLDDALWYEEHENVLISHGGPRMGASRQPTPTLHGGQAWQDERKEMFNRYVQHLDRAMEPLLFANGDPLVLAAVERDASAFANLSRHPNILKQFLHGNPEELAPSKLHSLTWQLVRDAFEGPEQQRFIDRFNELAATAGSSIESTEIFEAATSGRVDTVLIPTKDSRWKHVEPRATGGVDDFVNSVVIETLRHGGEAHFVAPRSLPDGVAIAAIFRWSQPNGNS
jgi:Bacterial archaeo-eukaryotic release factor family 3